jgi:hypothetical protein
MRIAIEGDSPVHALISLAKAFKAEGMSQREMYELFDLYRAEHQDDADETKYDAVLDTMDIIAGPCRREVRLFETVLRFQTDNPSAPNPEGPAEAN